MSKRVYIRTDASFLIGSGHVMRCLTLAEALRETGAKVEFVCRSHLGNLNELIRKKQFVVHELPYPKFPDFRTPSEASSNEDYAYWLGVSQEHDAEETVKVIQRKRPEWLIVDHYGLNQAWESRVRSYVEKLMVIDDLANRPHDCDLLLDQNYVDEYVTRYDNYVSKNTSKLLGPKYALLKPEYSESRKRLSPHSGYINKILVFMGGSDPDNLSGLAIETMSQSGLEAIYLDVVIGVNHQNFKEIKIQCESRGLAQWHTDLPHLAHLMSKANLCIGTGGATTWERLCMGLPTVVISTAENQLSICEALGEAGFIDYLGTSIKTSASLLSKKIEELTRNPEILIRQSQFGRQLVDGMGVQRVQGEML